jgi:hypothetical protein
MPADKYQSFKTLAFAAHIGEARIVTPSMINEMSRLLDDFDLRLPHLYSVSLFSINSTIKAY